MHSTIKRKFKGKQKQKKKKENKTKKIPAPSPQQQQQQKFKEDTGNVFHIWILIHETGYKTLASCSK